MSRDQKPNAQAILTRNDAGHADITPLSKEDMWRTYISVADCDKLADLFLPADRLWKSIALMITEDGVSFQVGDPWYRPGWDHLMVSSILMGHRTLKFRRAPANAITFEADLEEKILHIHLLSPTRESTKSEPSTEDAMRALGVPFALEDITDQLVINPQIIGIFHERCLRWEFFWEGCNLPGVKKMRELLTSPKDKDIHKVPDDLFDLRARTVQPAAVIRQIRGIGGSSTAAERQQQYRRETIANQEALAALRTASIAAALTRPNDIEEPPEARTRREQREAAAQVERERLNAQQLNQTRLSEQFQARDSMQITRTRWERTAPQLMNHLETQLRRIRPSPQAFPNTIVNLTRDFLSAAHWRDAGSITFHADPGILQVTGVLEIQLQRGATQTGTLRIRMLPETNANPAVLPRIPDERFDR